ncbi:MAG: protein kinase [Gammaproteobacteria bacterium]|nr:protein kinase [Gammaproteobacteria bacterium]
MSFLAGYQANKAIAALLTNQSSSTVSKQALLKIKKIGAPAIPKLINALSNTKNTPVIENLLLGLLNNQSLPIYIAALANQNAKIVEGIARVITKSDNYDVNLLLEQFHNTAISKKTLGEILLAHHQNLNANALLALLDKVSSNVRPVIYRILDKVVGDESVESLVQKSKSKEPMVRTHMATLLSRFNTEQSIDALIELLGDNNKSVRQSSLKGLAKLQAPQSIQPICQLLLDPDIMVQSVAIDTLVKIRDPHTVKFLIEVLQNESEYVRRAAVEVLNEVGDQRAIKDLLNALRDADWWVKVRAADALGAIGGPKVIDAVLLLIKDDDEFMRRSAVEILNTSKDKRAFDQLIDALKDEDWWVRERAADALASLGDQRAVLPLIKMLENNPDASQVVIRALATLGDKRAIKPLIQQLDHNNSNISKEALRALQHLTDAQHVQDVQNAVTALISKQNKELTPLAEETMHNLSAKFNIKSLEQKQTQAVTKANDVADEIKVNDAKSSDASLLVDFNAVKKSALEKISTVDATKFQPNDIFAQRFRIIRQVGKGAFGVVVLVEDTMVNDEFILKFLNPHFAADEIMIKRFTQELRYSRKVTHENIIRIYDLINYENTYAISMEYFPSYSLAKELKTSPVTPIPRALKLLDALCNGLIAAEQVNVVHRDLKPSNILIGENDMLKIVDFGLAAAASCIDSRLTKTGILVGTPTYMAPEQVKGKTIDSKTDIYSLGIIMYEIFTGTAPYKGEGALGVMYQHVEGNAIKPRELNDNIPEVLEKIVMKAIQVDPKERFQSFGELRKALSSVAEGLN